MQKNRTRGPVVTLAAVVALGGGLWWLNVSQETDATSPPTPVVNTTVVPAPPAPRPPAPSPPAPSFPAMANYAGAIPTKAAPITLDLAVDGADATAYACDGYSLEVWLRGSARNGALALASKDGTSRLEGRLRDTSIVGTLWIGEQKWDFTAPVAPTVSGS